MAQIYAMVRLLPKDHPYVTSASTGSFGVRHVVAEAARHIEFKWKNIDQILVFFALLTAIIMSLMYVVAMAGYLIFSPAFAMPSIIDLVTTLTPNTDIAFMMMDRTLGIPGVFNSDVATNVAKYGAFPNAFHIALQSLFEFYSMGLFLVCVFILLYYIVMIVHETAQTGKAFGQYFDDVWIPVRLIVGLGLLIPASLGLNSAQWITIYAAKFGSGMATNAWIAYNLETGDNPTGQTNAELIAKPSAPDASNLVKDLLLIRACMEMNSLEGRITGDWTMKETDAYLINGSNAQRLIGPTGTSDSYYFGNPADSYSASIAGIINQVAGNTFVDAHDFGERGDIRIVFGHRDNGANQYADKYPGGVIPICGEITVPVPVKTEEGLLTAEAYLYAALYTLYGIDRGTGLPVNANFEEAMNLAILREYFLFSSSYRHFLDIQMMGPGPLANENCYFDGDNTGFEEMSTGDFVVIGKCTEPVPSAYYNDIVNKFYVEAFSTAMETGYDYLTGEIIAENPIYSIGDTFYQNLGLPNPLLIDSGLLDYGWAGAGVWYNKISEKNGTLATAVRGLPSIVKYPMVMEQIKRSRIGSDAKVSEAGCELYEPSKSGNTAIELPGQSSEFAIEQGRILHRTCQILRENEQMVDSKYSFKAFMSDPVKSILGAIFGADQLMNFRDNSKVHPLAQLSALGKSMIDQAVFNLMAANGTAVAGGLAHLAGGTKGMSGLHAFGDALGNLSSAATSFAVIGVSMGAVLYYVVPFMPFMYFFFAVGAWVKTIFEALVGVPLWAMAHLRLEGPGLTGKAAGAGYFLILEIFIRPVVTVFALIAAFATFSAIMAVLNGIFDMVVYNLSGHDQPDLAANDPLNIEYYRTPVDQFFYTVMYVILAYLTASSCFKLINIIPDSIMRWSGSGVSTFGKSDPSEHQVGQASMIVSMSTYKATGVVAGAGKQLVYEPGEKIGKAMTAENMAAAAKNAPKGGGSES